MAESYLCGYLRIQGKIFFFLLLQYNIHYVCILERGEKSPHLY